MIIYDLPPVSDQGRLSAACLGSCRVHKPLQALATKDELRIRTIGLNATHTAAEALQTLQVVLGEKVIPPGLGRYAFGSKPPYQTSRLRSEMERGVEIYLLEVCDDRQLLYDKFCFQVNYVALGLVRPYGAALLKWFRRLCSGSAVDEGCISDALEALREAGHPCDEEMAGLLRGIKFERQEGEAIEQDLGAMMSMTGGRWVVVGAFDVPGRDGDVMRNRRSLNEKLKDAADHCGAEFYDPSQLVAQHGPAVALEGGTNINEYAKSFHPTVGRTLVELTRQRSSMTKAMDLTSA